MSIVNISSENKANAEDNDNEFEINLKKSLQKCVGLQLLNVTVPLSYNVITQEDRQVAFEQAGSNYNVNLRIGTNSVDELAQNIEQAMNFAQYPGLPIDRNVNQRRLHIDQRRQSFLVGIRDKADRTYGSLIQVSHKRIEPGMIVHYSGSYRVVEVWDTATNTGVLVSQNGTLTQISGTEGTLQDNQVLYGGHQLFISYRGYLSFFDNINQRLKVSGEAAFSFKGGSMSRRMCKTIGCDKSAGDLAALQGNAGNPIDDKDDNFPFILKFQNLPEVSGPSMLFLRISGDPLLDQQNSETHMNDRIPIPVDQPHGGVVHYENDSESDVIPFSVPCDVRNLRFRLEYGDDNELVGGKSNAMSGHHVYVRLKFFKLHQNHQKL